MSEDLSAAAEIVAAALRADVSGRTPEQLSTRLRAAVWSLRHQVAALLDDDALTAPAQRLQADLARLSNAELRGLVLVARVVLAQAGGAAEGRRPAQSAEETGDVQVLWASGRSSQTMSIDPEPLASLGVVARRSAVLSQPRSPQHTAAFISLVQRQLADQEYRLGSGHTLTLGSRTKLADLYWSAGRADEAIQTLEQAVADYRRASGPNHRDTLAAEARLRQWRSHRASS